MGWVQPSLGGMGGCWHRAGMERLARATPARRHPWNAAAQHPPPREFPAGATEKELVPSPRRLGLSFYSGRIGDVGPRRVADVRSGTRRGQWGRRGHILNDAPESPSRPHPR